MPINIDTLNRIISGLNAMPKKSEIDTVSNDIDALATTDHDGLMSAEDKTKLDNIAEIVTYVHPTTSGYKHIPSGGSSGQILKWESDGTAKWATETKYGLATTSSGGLMSSTDKANLDAAVSKLSGIAEGANNYSLPIASNSQLGGVKTTSNVTNTSGLTPCPIIDGVPYYMDTVGSYTLPTASNTTLGGVTTTSTVTSTTGLTACPIIAGIPYYPSTLPATGGNADTVDGLHASDFMPINGEVRKYGLIRMNSADGIRARHIDGNDTEFDGALYLNYNSPNAPIYMNGVNTAIHSGNIGSQSVNYATNAGNAQTLSNITNGYYLGTFDINGGGHGAAHRLQCQYRKFGDDRFGLKIESGYEVRCDYATAASNSDTVGGITDGYYLGLFNNNDTKLSADMRLYGKYNGKTNDGRIFLTTTRNSENKIHEVSVTYAYDAELLNHRESGRIATKKIDGTYYNPTNKDTNDAYIQWNGSHFVLKTYGGNSTAVDYATNANSATYANIVKTPYLIGTSSNCAYNTILAWANAQTGMACASIVAGDGYPSDAPYQNEAMLTVESDYYGARKIVTWTRYLSGQPRLVMIRTIFGGDWSDINWRTHTG